MEFCKIILISYPNNEVVLAYTGRLYFESKEMEKAVEAMNKALEINPKFEEAWGLLGRIYTHTGEKQKALEAYDTALEIDSGLEQVKALRNQLLKDDRKSL